MRQRILPAEVFIPIGFESVFLWLLSLWRVLEVQFLLELIDHLALPELLHGLLLVIKLIRGVVDFKRSKRWWPLEIVHVVFSLAGV